MDKMKGINEAVFTKTAVSVDVERLESFCGVINAILKISVAVIVNLPLVAT